MTAAGGRKRERLLVQRSKLFGKRGENNFGHRKLDAAERSASIKIVIVMVFNLKQNKSRCGSVW